jgi:chromosome segregation ATPase
MDQTIVSIVVAVVGLFGGAFGIKLLDKWSELAKRKDEAAATEDARAFADSESARVWLREELRERDGELRAVKDSERTLLKHVGELTAQVARQEERSAAQAIQITALQEAMTKLGSDYLEMKTERDEYRDQKHELTNRLTGESIRAQLAERDLAARDQEIERLRAQLAAALTRPTTEEVA